MPTIPVDEQQHVLYYDDSGLPTTSPEPYTTLMIVHGTGFHSAIFRRLVPIAPEYNIRLVLINRRGYPHSSDYTEEDLEKISGTDEESHNEFAASRAKEFATFIERFIDQERIPEASADWKQGGVALMGWSSGNSYALPMLAFADLIPESTRNAIEPYLRAFVIFDVARWVFGGAATDPGIDLLNDQTLTEAERARSFALLVSSYFTHKSLTSRDIADLQRKPDPNARKATIDRFTPEEECEVTCYSALFRNELAARTASHVVYAARMDKALFESASYWPKCRVDLILCENTSFLCVEAAWEFDKIREKAEKEGRQGRVMRSFMIPGVNHFAHWDYPDITMKNLAQVVKS